LGLWGDLGWLGLDCCHLVGLSLYGRGSSLLLSDLLLNSSGSLLGSGLSRRLDTSSNLLRTLAGLLDDSGRLNTGCLRDNGLSLEFLDDHSDAGVDELTHG
jgi:hypothetical protein